MIFFSHKIKFKKQSESLGLNLNDKYIKNSKEELIQLTNKHQKVDESLKKKKVEFEKQKNKLIAEHQFLIKEEKRHRLKILKLQVRKDQLFSKKNPEISHKKAEILKKYLKCMIYTIGDKFQIIRSMNNETTYDFIKTKVLNLELRIYLKAKMKEVVFMKKLDFEKQKLMLVIKEKDSMCVKSSQQNDNSSNKSKTVKSILNPSKFNPVSDDQLTMKKFYQVKLYAVTGKAFQFTKVYEQRQFTRFIEKLIDQKKELLFDTLTNLKNPLLDGSRKPRLSLQFNSVFKKSLQGFFFKRTSLTSNQLQNKLVNIQEWIKQSKNTQRNIGDSDRSRTQQNHSICQSSQDRQDHSELNSSMKSKETYVDKSKDSLASLNYQNAYHEQKQQKMSNFNGNLFPSFQEENSYDNNKAIESANYNMPSNHEDSDLSNNNTITSKINSSSTESGFIRSFICGQKILFPDSNPLLNIVIIKKKGEFFFLPEYLENQKNFNLINYCVKKYQLKIKLQKEVRKSLLYKIIKIENFFQTQNESMQPFTLQLLFSVKYAKNDIYVPKINDIKEHQKMGKQFQGHAYLKGRKDSVFENLGRDLRGYNDQDIVISCQNIRCQSEERTFLVHHILKEELYGEINNRVFNMLNNVNTVNTRLKGRTQNIDVKNKKNEIKQEDVEKSKEDKRRTRKKKVSKDVVSKAQEMKQELERKEFFFREEIQSLFDSFIESNCLSIKEYRFLRRINFEQHTDKVIMIQKNLKCFFYRKKYRLYQRGKKNQFIFKFESITKILITAMLDVDSQNIKIFTECLVLRLNQKYKSYPIVYSDRYWATIGSSLNNLMRLSDSIVEIKDQLQKYLQKKIKIFEQEQARLEALKPQLYLNRLRRFFINIMLRVKAKKNIVHLQKLNHNSESYVLIIRKSPILKNVCQANLYHLEEFIQKEQNKENLNQNEQLNSQLDINQQKTMKTLNRDQIHYFRRHKSKYQTINLLVDYFANISKNKISDEFYFDNQHFLLKPPRSSSIYFIERLLMIDINSEQISKEVAMIEWQDPAKRKKNSDHNSFLTFETKDKNNFILSSLSSSQAHNLKESSVKQQKNFRLKRKNASIMLQDSTSDLQNKLLVPLISDSVNEKSRRSFRISERNNCKIFEEKGRKNRNSKLVLSKNEVPSLNPQESSNKLSSGGRLSRSSLYDIFNNSYNNKKIQYEIKDNGHRKLLYYSLAKVEQIFYQLHIYTVKRRFMVKRAPTSDEQWTQPQPLPSPISNPTPQQPLASTQQPAHQKLPSAQYIANYHCQQESVVSQQHEYLRKNAFSDQLFLVYRENLTKKELLEANWAFVYNKIAKWIKNNENMLLLVEEGLSKAVV